MKQRLKEAPALGLYLALIWCTLIAIPFAIFNDELNQLFKEVSTTWRNIGARHG